MPYLHHPVRLYIEAGPSGLRPHALEVTPELAVAFGYFHGQTGGHLIDVQHVLDFILGSERTRLDQVRSALASSVVYREVGDEIETNTLTSCRRRGIAYDEAFRTELLCYGQEHFTPEMLGSLPTTKPVWPNNHPPVARPAPELIGYASMRPAPRIRL